MVENTLNVKLHGLRRNRHGSDFQLAVIEYAIVKLLLKQKKDFTLGSENAIDYAKFDDMVISFKDNNDDILHLYQMKHSFEPMNLNKDDLKSEFFNIEKHFNAWKAIKEKVENKNKTLKFYLVTNKNLDPTSFNEYIRKYIYEYVNKKNHEKKNIMIYEEGIDQLLQNILTNKIAILSAHLDECHKEGIEEIIKNKLKDNNDMIKNLIKSIDSFVKNQKNQKIGKYEQINDFWEQGDEHTKYLNIKNFIDNFSLVVECKNREENTLKKLVKWLSLKGKQELKGLIENGINQISDDDKILIRNAINDYITKIKEEEYKTETETLKNWKFIDSTDLYADLQRILPNAEVYYLNDLEEELNKLKENLIDLNVIVEKKENEIFEEFSLFEIKNFDHTKIFRSENIDHEFKDFLTNLKIIQLPHVDKLIPKIQAIVKEDVFNRFHIFMEEWFRSNRYTINSKDLKTINILSNNLVHEE